MQRFWSLVLALGLSTACSAGLPEPGAAHLAAARARDPGARLADLTRGRSLYVARCAGCHTLKDPAVLSAEAWGGVVAKMEREEGVKLEPDEARDIVRYLGAASLVAMR